MSVFVRIVIVFMVVVALAAGASAASADRFSQATATPAAAATATAIPCTTAPAGIVIILENPNPGDTISTGVQLVINGIAYDPAADTGAGILSVTIYLGDRAAGGTPLGTAILGQPNPLAATGSQFATAGFKLTTPALPAGSGARTIFVYARSLVTNNEAVLQVPVFLNSAPTPVKGQAPTAVLPTPPACTPTPTATATSVPTVAPPVVVARTATPTTVLPPTPTPLTVSAPLPTVAPPAPAPAAKPAATAAPVTVAPATAQSTAPRGGGIPPELGLILLGAGVVIVVGGLALRRRERRGS